MRLTKPIEQMTPEEKAALVVQMKAAGGIRDLDTLLAVREIGVSRCGASRTKEMLDEAKRRLNSPSPSGRGPG